MKYAESEYVAYDPYEGDEADIKLRTVKLVKVRKEHQCFMGAAPLGDKHTIACGDIARFEKALVDGDFWGKSYVCVPCMDKWLDDVIGEGCDE
ncbi:hypothetical protein [Paraburkholderia fungorum]|uniref:hypothetical protein n=1 Tax=Paraburkholderia fungorum TaxID=134537 RepID=UPI001620E5B1|nr:hypothetical protein [Paraburkholderia fungorum]MBB5547506.1 hypothetical protein [Paraburkholderia fungorum]